MSGSIGDNVFRASGVVAAAAAGRTGTVDWDTTPKTGTVTAEDGVGYFVDTSAAARTVDLPAGSAGAIVSISDYTRTFATNNCTVAPNGSEKIGGIDQDALLEENGQSATFVYVDSTEGWINVQETQTSVTGVSTFIIASGGNTTITDGDYKIHVFTGPGTFCVSAAGNACGSNTVDYLVIAGGGGGGGPHGGGGGAGGLRTFMPASTPMAAPAGIAVPEQAYSITVGAGGPSGLTGPSATPHTGSDSIFSSITSAGGGGGGAAGIPGANGGSGGGGGAQPASAGSASPTTSPAQGTAGGAGGSSPNYVGGGGGGASAAGGAPPGSAAGVGGDGGYIPDAMFGPTAPSYGTPGPASSTRYWAGGGGGGGWQGPGSPGAAGGAGGGATGSSVAGGQGGCAAANTSGGGGGGNDATAPGGPGGAGGSGTVIIRYKFQ